jgi:hypothetical protein
MKFGLLLLGIVAVALAACGGGGNSNRAAEARAVRDEIVSAMNEVESFRGVFSIETPLFTMEIIEPDTFRIAKAGPLAETEEGTQAETLYIGDTIYERSCAAGGASCDAWQTSDRESEGVTLGTYDPRWPVVALEMADRVSVSDGVLRGTVNQIRAIFETIRRVQNEAGVTPQFTRSCTSAVTPVEIREGTPVSTPRRTTEDDLDCRELSFDESLVDQEPGLSFIDEHPSTIEAEFDPDTHLMSRFTITMIDEDYEGGGSPQPSGETSTITFTYSNYDEITIEAPE